MAGLLGSDQWRDASGRDPAHTVAFIGVGVTDVNFGMFYLLLLSDR
jgi:hypothetical protein